MRLVILLILGLILFSLGSGLFHLVGGSADSSKKLVKSLTWRISLSIGLLILLLVAWSLGWIAPNEMFAPPAE